jgi:nitroreductase
VNLESFEELALERRAVRHFKPDPLPGGMLERLLDAARWAPSGYNLQPAHFVAVTDEATRHALCPACFSQPQVREAPVTVVFVGDPHVVRNNLEKMIALELEAGAIGKEREAGLRKFIGLAFGTGPAGLGWLLKAVLPALASPFRCMPEFPAVHRRFWLTKQVMLAAMNFMLAAKAAGLATVPMEGFDERRVKRVLGIPRSHSVPVLIPVGYAADENLKKTRLPLQEMLHRDRWQGA